MISLKKFFIVVVSLFVVYLLFSYFLGSDEEKIRDIIKETTNAFNAGDSGGVFTNVSLEFEDDHGIKYLPAKYIINNFLKKIDNVNLRIPDISIVLNGDEANVTLSVILTGSKRGVSYNVLGERDNPVIVDMLLKKGITGWKIHETKNIRPSNEYLKNR